MTPQYPLHDFPAEHFLNREFSLLAFNRRVLAQAADVRMPLLERLRFLCIVSSNLDEFFEIRVAGVKEQIKMRSNATGPDRRSAQEVYRRIIKEAHVLIDEQYALLKGEILPALAKEGIVILRRTEWTEAQQNWVRDYFHREVMPVLTPIGLDPAHPFPRVLNKSLNFAVELEGKDAFGRNSGAAIVQAPRTLPRVIRLPHELADVDHAFVFLSSILHRHVGELFSGMAVQGCYQFRVTRNSNLFVDDEEVKNLRTALQGELPHRHFGDGVRLEVADNCSEDMTDFLLQQFVLNRDDLYQVPGIVNLVRLMSLPDQVDRPDLKFPVFQPGLPKQLTGRYDMFECIRKNDILLHHPFQAFAPVIVFLKQATEDPQVVAIKMTIYRTGTDSVLMEHLLRAAQKGKEVSVVVELMARFDEEANLSIAARLEEAGAHVVYGVFGYKTHAKMIMVLRREETGFRRYVHLGTGNYHPRTSRLYTDFGLLTCNDEIAGDVNDVFRQLTGLGKASALKHLWQSPFTLHSNMLEAIHAETAAARAGRKAHIIAKMNSLLEPEIIEALYTASQAGVHIDLIVRGVCCLRPGVKGLSENIHVRSVIGRFLEHHRIYYFYADGAENLYLASADWMERNFFRRIEVCFPVLEPKLKRRVIKEGLRNYLADNCQAWDMDSDGQYQIKPSRRVRTCTQDLLLAQLAD
ncbi:MAG: polyphosphate kinase 1 [Gammaproteobacteria bacterium]|nr:polyphosphate kinase 1 [Rhodocyclaceae bacterium]MBU3909833.1 polyphosphate kinase 1 [Gammaproteobacteria bacterium]MBU3988065.1 polyphosphate kinase 1 [Gammaproteobacteria bacterium]MBU4003588.1 polyphosphate kinase 1 [Gammaproteobacteria bacterium]MBU4020053.1 polyphosphate kinase 1 [Gammaproteobacteria bacterium]